MIPHPRRTVLWSGTDSPSERTLSDGCSASVVVADADRHLRDIYRTLLGLHGFRVAEAADGVEALQMVRELRPDIALLDVDLPRLDGLKATRALRQGTSTAATAVILLSIYSDPLVRRRALQAGCSGYIAKPFDAHELVAEVGRVFGAAARLRESA